MDNSIQNLRSRIDLGKGFLLQQEAINKEFTTKASGVLAFSSGLLALTHDVLNWESVLTWTTIACYSVVLVLTLLMIMRAQMWFTPYILLEYGLDEQDWEVDHVEFLMRIVRTYRVATDKNSKKLVRKATILTWTIYFALAEFVSALCLFMGICL